MNIIDIRQDNWWILFQKQWKNQLQQLLSSIDLIDENSGIKEYDWNFQLNAIEWIT
jgi:hypothetical protein